MVLSSLGVLCRGCGWVRVELVFLFDFDFYYEPWFGVFWVRTTGNGRFLRWRFFMRCGQLTDAMAILDRKALRPLIYCPVDPPACLRGEPKQTFIGSAAGARGGEAKAVKKTARCSRGWLSALAGGRSYGRHGC